jgi:phosphopantetheinyl transferase (holo-ACP synthase)
MPRSFLFALGIGTDICHIPRIRKILVGKAGAQFMKRVLNDNERVVYASKFKAFEAYKRGEASKEEILPSVQKAMNIRAWHLARFLSGR